MGMGGRAVAGAHGDSATPSHHTHLGGREAVHLELDLCLGRGRGGKGMPPSGFGVVRTRNGSCGRGGVSPHTADNAAAKCHKHVRGCVCADEAPGPSAPNLFGRHRSLDRQAQTHTQTNLIAGEDLPSCRAGEHPRLRHRQRARSEQGRGGLHCDGLDQAHKSKNKN